MIFLDVHLICHVKAPTVAELPHPSQVRDHVMYETRSGNEPHPWSFDSVRVAPGLRVPKISLCCAREVYFDTAPYCTGCFQDVPKEPTR